MRALLVAVAWLGFAAYSVAWFVVALASNPTWWWFVPIYGDIKIFQASVWWELFHVGAISLIVLLATIMEE